MDEDILLSMKSYLARLRRDEQQKVYAPLADAYRRTGLLNDAEFTASDGLSRFPTYLLCREVLGKVYFKVGKLDQAKEQLEKVAKVIKDNPELSRILGKLYMEMEIYEDAKRHLSYVAEKDPFDFEAKNLLIEIERRTAAPEEDEAEDGADLFGASDEERVTDIESIIAGMEEPEILEKDKYVSATDTALDTLEDFEDDIDHAADEIFANYAEDMAEARVERVTKRKVYRERPEVYKTKQKEIHAAAVIGQIHMELHLLDELLILTQKLLKQDPEDQDLKILADKFEKELDTKEKELEELENSSSATGL